MKNASKYVITAVVAIVVIVTASVFIRSNSKKFSNTLQALSNSLTTEVGVVANPQQATAAPTAAPAATTASGTTATTPAATDVVPTSAQASAGAMTNAQTLTMLNNALSTLRHTEQFTGVKDQVIAIKLTDCSMPAFTSAINSVIDKMGGTKSLTFNFVDGKATDPESNETVTPMQAIPPTDIEFTLEEAGIVSLSSAADGANTTYTVTLIAEDSSLTSKPKYHAQTMDILDLTAVDLPITVTAADFHYTGATIEITLDESGRVVRFREYMPLHGNGAGKLGILSAEAEIDGYLDEVWTIQY